MASRKDRVVGRGTRWQVLNTQILAVKEKVSLAFTGLGLGQTEVPGNCVCPPTPGHLLRTWILTQEVKQGPIPFSQKMPGGS